jgi:hypothetical protein
MRAALEMADIFRHHGAAFREAHAAQFGRTERCVTAAIQACRTPASGGHADHCGDYVLVGRASNSCRNRLCQKCQGLARADLLAERQAELLPVPYVHKVFTLPSPAAEIVFHNKATVYAILFRAAAEALRGVAGGPVGHFAWHRSAPRPDRCYLGAEIGATAGPRNPDHQVRGRPWGQALYHHPQLHCIVPGRGIWPGWPASDSNAPSRSRKCAPPCRPSAISG